MILLIVPILTATAPRLGTLSKDEAFVLVGTRWLKASFSDKRKLQAGEKPIRHPSVKYRLVSTIQKNEAGEMSAFSVVDSREKVVAPAAEIIGRRMASKRGEVGALGWGPGGNSIVLNRINPWNASEVSYEICSLNLETHRPNPRVEIACTPTLSLVLGETSMLDGSEGRENADYPHLYRRARGRAPSPIRWLRHTVCAGSLEVSRDGRWALVHDEPLKEFPRNSFHGQWLLVDVVRGTACAVPSKDGGSTMRFLN